MIYAVIDTNVLVSALLTKRADSPTLKIVYSLWRGEITPLYNDYILWEYNEVLRRKKFHLEEELIESIISFIETNGRCMESTSFDSAMPDERDRPFYEVSLSEERSFLVTGNLKHFPQSPMVLSPRQFLEETGLDN